MKNLDHIKLQAAETRAIPQVAIQQFTAADIRACANGLRDGMGGHADYCADIMEQLAKKIAAAEQAQQAEPVAWFYADNFDKQDNLYRRTTVKDVADGFARQGRRVIAQYDAAQPPAVAVPGAVDLLREMEWENNRFADACPVCASNREQGHAADCKLAAVLAAAQKGGA